MGSVEVILQPGDSVYDKEGTLFSFRYLETEEEFIKRVVDFVLTKMPRVR